jgi:hypothetical protein
MDSRVVPVICWLDAAGQRAVQLMYSYNRGGTLVKSCKGTSTAGIGEESTRGWCLPTIRCSMVNLQRCFDGRSRKILQNGGEISLGLFGTRFGCWWLVTNGSITVASDFNLPKFKLLAEPARTFNVPSIALLRLRSAMKMRDTISRTNNFAVFEWLSFIINAIWFFSDHFANLAFLPELH